MPNQPVADSSLPTPPVTLNDKYALARGAAYLTGTQALLRLLINQRLRDGAAGLQTAAFVSGYRGSPVGGLDLALYKAADLLKQHAIVFNPGVNEELAATSIWGTQQTGLYGDATVQGVLGLWYGKGPGVDRCPDVWRHASGAGTSPLGGVLAIAGDDTAAKSSTYPNHSDGIFASVGMPLLAPASVQQMLDFGIHGYAMSRFCGAWVGMKVVTDVIESAAVVEVDAQRVQTVVPTDFALPEGGLHIRWPDTPQAIGARVWEHKIPAALAYARANGLNQRVFGEGKTLGIVTAGKSVGDTIEALQLLGLSEADCSSQGISVFQCGMIWPLEPHALQAFASGLQTLLVVESLRPTLESQVKEQLFGAAQAPRVMGKNVLPLTGDLSPLQVAHAIAQLLPAAIQTAALANLHALMHAAAAQGDAALEQRQPWFCSGCPHSTSTRVPEGSRALAGIGCHYMAQWMDRSTQTFTQMGGEGTPWIGAAPFSTTPHVFANLGDGTYFHSGVLAVRAAIAAKVNITYKILYNDAVSMTGGQPHDGQVTAHSLAAQMLAEGAQRVCVVSYQPERFDHNPLPAGVLLHARADLDAVQRALREQAGCTVLIYDQPCATEKRRKQKTTPLPLAQRQYAMINPDVCEGCGDCSVQSNCLSVEPLDTPLGRKRAINQSSCNTDLSCIKGFCPSFVTVSGAALRRPASQAALLVQSAQTMQPAHSKWPAVPLPQIPLLASPLGILVAGIGGTGVVTIGQLLGMAAHLEGKGCSVLDMSGLAQKGGPVHSHIRLLPAPLQRPSAAKLAPQQARVVLACDAVVATTLDAVACIAPDAAVLLNLAANPTAAVLAQRNWEYPAAACAGALQTAAHLGTVQPWDAQAAALALLGDAIYANPMMLGYAWQSGWLPLAHAALHEAIRLNGTQIERNLAAFEWGRLAAQDAAAFAAQLPTRQTVQRLNFKPRDTVDSVLADRSARLAAYQNAAYAQRYAALVARVRAAEVALAGSKPSLPLTLAVAKNLFTLMAIKDEYEVARLYTLPAFAAQLKAQFDDGGTVHLHLAPPLLGKTDARGQPIKQAFNAAWVMPLFKLLAACKVVRGSALNVFGNTAERRMERALLANYEASVAQLVAGLASGVGSDAGLGASHLALAVEIASLPAQVRGFGHVKAAAAAAHDAKHAALWQRWLAR